MLTDLEIEVQVTCGIFRLICLRSVGKEDEWDGRDREDSKEAG
jgi:hypothetical protein